MAKFATERINRLRRYSKLLKLAQFLVLFPLLVLAVALAGCGGTDTSQSSDSSSSGSGSTPTPSQYEFTESDMQGTWDSPSCVAIQDGSGERFTNKATLSGSTYTTMQDNFNYLGDNPTCSFKEISLRFVYDGTLGSNYSTPSGYQARQTTTTLTGAYLTLWDSRQVSYANSIGTCGYTDWVSGVERDAIDRHCVTIDGGVTGAYTGQTSYGLAYVDESYTPWRLYGGDSSTGDGTTTSTRPTELDTTDYLSKE